MDCLHYFWSQVRYQLSTSLFLTMLLLQITTARNSGCGNAKFSRVSDSHCVHRGCACLVPGPFKGVGISRGGYVWGWVGMFGGRVCPEDEYPPSEHSPPVLTSSALSVINTDQHSHLLNIIFNVVVVKVTLLVAHGVAFSPIERQ